MGWSLSETGAENQRRLWWRGGFPRSFLSESDEESREWRSDFIQTFLERDLRRYGVQVPPAMLHRFWSMVAHYHGQIWNASEIDLIVFIDGRRFEFEETLERIPSIEMKQFLDVFGWEGNVNTRGPITDFPAHCVHRCAFVVPGLSLWGM